MDYPLKHTFLGAKITYREKAREDLPWVEDEFDQEFRQWIMNFPGSNCPRSELLDKYQKKRKFIIFKSRKKQEYPGTAAGKNVYRLQKRSKAEPVFGTGRRQSSGRACTGRDGRDYVDMIPKAGLCDGHAGRLLFSGRQAR